MKQILICLSVLFLSCSGNKKLVNGSSHHGFSWLEGDWVRTNGPTGKETLESWIKSDTNRYVGSGKTFDNGVVSWSEKMELYKDKNNWYLTVKDSNSQKTTFEIITMEDGRFICENKYHDFPQRIEYHRTGEDLHAVLYGQGRSTVFFFKPALEK